MRTAKAFLALLLTVGACSESIDSSASALIPLPPLPITSCLASSQVTGLIATEWFKLNGASGPLGCATKLPMATGDVQGGWMQQFQHGQIAFSPNDGISFVVAAYQADGALFVDWGPTDPYSYDYFNVRWDRNGVNVGQRTLHAGEPGISRTGGNQWFLSPADWSSDPDLYRIPGDYRIVVEGCDNGGLGGSTCNQGWSAALLVHYSPNTIDLSTVPLAETPDQAYAGYDYRAKVVLEYEACTVNMPLSGLPSGALGDESDFTTNAIAKMEIGCCPGGPSVWTANGCPNGSRNLVPDVNAGLANTVLPGKPGTNGEWDVALRGLMPIMFRHDPYQPQPAGKNVPVISTVEYDHVLHDLLTLYGPMNPADEIYEWIGGYWVWETENHLLQMESSRFLTNLLLTREATRLQRTPDPSWNNDTNGVTLWLERYLQSFLQHDFSEYNARPYQHYAVGAIQNLYDFAPPGHPVQVGAGLVLDFLAAKFAVSSNMLRDHSPFRRRKENKDINELLYDHVNVQSYRFMVQSGQLDRLADMDPPFHAHKYAIGDMVQAAWTSYRIPQLILDVAMDKVRNPYFQRLYGGTHGARQNSWRAIPEGVEIYSSAAPFLITAGGIWMESGHGFDDVPMPPLPGNTPYQDVGWAMETTLMPTGFGDNVSDLIRFVGATPGDRIRQNTCVAPGFACGMNPIVPSSYKNSWQDGQWTFVDASNLGFYAAVWSASCASGDTPCSFTATGGIGVGGSFGLLDAAPSSMMSLTTFASRVKANAGPFNWSASNTYVTSQGHTIQFAPIAGDKYRWSILSIDGVPQTNDISTWPMAQGDVISSGSNPADAHSGYLRVTNPYSKASCTLDYRDMTRPTRSCDAPFTVQIVTPIAGTAIPIGLSNTTFQARNVSSSNPTVFDWTATVNGHTTYLGRGATITSGLREPGTTIVTCTGNDAGLTSSASVVVRVLDPGPTARIDLPTAGASVYRNQIFQLSGGASSTIDLFEPCGRLTWTADQVPGWWFVGCSEQIQFDRTGPLTLRLTATDEFGVAGPQASTTINLLAPPSTNGPIVTILAPQLASTGQAILLGSGHISVSGSVYDPNNGAVTYHWTVFDSITGVETSLLSLSAFTWEPDLTQAGNWDGELRLYGSDAQGRTNEARLPIHVYTLQ